MRSIPHSNRRRKGARQAPRLRNRSSRLDLPDFDDEEKTVEIGCDSADEKLTGG